MLCRKCLSDGLIVSSHHTFLTLHFRMVLFFIFETHCPTFAPTFMLWLARCTEVRKEPECLLSQALFFSSLKVVLSAPVSENMLHYQHVWLILCHVPFNYGSLFTILSSLAVQNTSTLLVCNMVRQRVFITSSVSANYLTFTYPFSQCTAGRKLEHIVLLQPANQKLSI